MDTTQNSTDPFAESLQQLAGLDLESVEAIRFEQLPAIRAGFSIAGIETKGRETDSGPRLFIEVKAQVVEVLASADPAYESAEAKASLVGKFHTQGFVVDPNDAAKALGRLKAFLQDIGYAGPTKIGEMMEAVKGHKFIGEIKLSKSKKDPTRTYANLNPVKETASSKLKV